jgi:predicted NBD/HSP70 family sugar kinase
LAGALPEVNARLAAAGSAKRFHNLLGFTWGTGFGFGMSVDNRMHVGDNSCVEIYCLRNRIYPDAIVEDSVSIRAVQRVYGELSGEPNHGLTPKEIYEIAEGTREGDRAAAIGSFAEFGRATGDAFASVASLLDGLIVVGGGLTGARKYIMPSVLAEMRSTLSQLTEGERTERMPVAVYELDDEAQFERFARGQQCELKVYGSDRTVSYDPEKRIGIVFSKLGASRAVSLGAYAFALNELDSRK